MTKIPVGATIAQAYRFAFGSFLKILGVAWLPWAVMAVVGFLALRQVAAVVNGITSQDFAATAHGLPLLAALYILMFVLLGMQFVGMARLALGLPLPSPYFYFTLGKPVWRLLAAFLLLLLILIAFSAGAGIVAGVLGALVAMATGAQPGVPNAVMGLGAIILALIVYAAILYGMVRFTFFLIPVVVAQERIGLKRAWQLGKGNFWRAFAVLLAIFLPLLALEFVWLLGPWGPGFPPPMPPRPTPEQLAAYQAGVAHWAGYFSRLMTDGWYIAGPIFLAATVLFYGAMVGAQCFAYRRVTEGGAAD